MDAEQPHDDDARSARIATAGLVTILIFTVTAAVADVAATRSVWADGAGTRVGPLVLLASSAWAIGIAGAAVLVFGALAMVARTMRALPRPVVAVRYLVATAPLAGFLCVGGLALLRGAGVSAKPWIAAARGGAALIALVIPPSVAWLLRQVVILRRTPRVVRIACAGFTVACMVSAIVIDARVYPHLYPLAHLLLWAGVLAGCGWLGSHWAFSRRRVPSVGRLGFAFLALLMFPVVAVAVRPLGGAATRAIALRDTLFLRRVLADVFPGALPSDGPGESPALVSGDLLPAPPGPVESAALDARVPQRRALNVLFVSIDALRADRVGLQGPRRLTPVIDAFAAESVRFTAAWTAYPSTRFAVLSLFTSRDPSATDLYASLHTPGARPLAARPTLPKILREHGRRTEAVTAFGPSLSREVIPNDLGFETYNRHSQQRHGDGELDARETTSYLLQALDRDPARPFFIWAHYFDPHDPYAPPTGAIYGNSDADRYDAEVRFTDDQLGTLLSALRTRGRMKDTVVVIFADHGEELGEGGLQYHDVALTEREIHVPLVIFVPGISHREVTTPVSLIDLMPTVLELLGIDAPHGMLGRSLLAGMLGMADADEGLAFAELDNPWLGAEGLQFAVARGPLKLVWQPKGGLAGLFDLRSDPREEHDLSADRPEDFRRLDGILNVCRQRGAEAAAAATALAESEPNLDARRKEIVSALRDYDFWVVRKGWALDDALLLGCPKEALPAVAALVDPGHRRENPDPFRARAVRILARSDDPAMVARALECSHDPSPLVRREAAVVRARRGDPSWRTEFPESLAECDCDTAIQRLRAKVWAGDPDARQRAITMLLSPTLDPVDARSLFSAVASRGLTEQIWYGMLVWARSHDGRRLMEGLLASSPFAEAPAYLREPLLRQAAPRGRDWTDVWTDFAGAEGQDPLKRAGLVREAARLAPEIGAHLATMNAAPSKPSECLVRTEDSSRRSAGDHLVYVRWRFSPAPGTDELVTTRLAATVEWRLSDGRVVPCPVTPPAPLPLTRLHRGESFAAVTRVAIPSTVPLDAFPVIVLRQR